MRKMRILFGVCLAIWALVIFLGVNLYSGIIMQKVAGYPTPGQFYTCIVLPCALLTSNILALLFYSKLHWLILAAFCLLQLLAFLAFFFILSGGV